MPVISRFFGISIYMYFNEHNPPHFHAVYGEYQASITIESLSMLSGYLPPRVFGLVLEWASIHKSELMKVWQQAFNKLIIDKIEPLK